MPHPFSEDPSSSASGPGTGDGPVDRESTPGENEADRPRGSPYPRLLLTALLVLVVDQATKSLALEKLQRGPVDVIEGVLSLDLSFNPGGVFGVGQSVPNLFLIATMIVIAAILLWVRSVEARPWLVPLGLVLGGGLGNVTDRLFRGFEGRVVDFIDLHVWPVFNVADMAIVIGVGLVLLAGFRSER